MVDAVTAYASGWNGDSGETSDRRNFRSRRTGKHNRRWCRCFQPDCAREGDEDGHGDISKLHR